jgi:hypothetical protein
MLWPSLERFVRRGSMPAHRHPTRASVGGSEHWAQRVGLKLAAFLIRPDGYVGYWSAALKLDRPFEHLALTLDGRTPRLSAATGARRVEPHRRVGVERDPARLDDQGIRAA